MPQPSADLPFDGESSGDELVSFMAGRDGGEISDGFLLVVGLHSLRWDNTMVDGECMAGKFEWNARECRDLAGRY